MTVSGMQNNLIDAIKTIVNNELNNVSASQSMTGVVVEDPVGYKCIVKVSGVEMECTLPEHLHDWISKDDIVVIQDLYGNGAELVITGSSGTTRNQSLVISDESRDKGKLVSGVTKFEDEDGNLFDHELTVK
ncbi:hypothetical protein [Lactobacillus taiwanensis]|uniref:hypothetical protein n=1 Tax=Lactobacillus taiwanensis TaxID=508451 RepID=UPI00321FA888